MMTWGLLEIIFNGERWFQGRPTAVGAACGECRRHWRHHANACLRRTAARDATLVVDAFNASCAQAPLRVWLASPLLRGT